MSANLFWKRGKKSTLNLLSVPFASEADFETAVFEAKGLLQDVHFLKRQIRGGKKSGIPDIVGVDRDGSICIVEMKNVSVDSGILPQVLQYAFWAESNPDSIKALWHEASETPEDVTIDFDNYRVRVIIIAPNIDHEVLRLLTKINYQVDLIEVTRWKENHNEFLLMNHLETELPTKVRPVRALAIYDREFYLEHYNRTSVDQFLRYADETAKEVKRLGLPLELKFNRYYCTFKYGFFNAFGIKWLGTKSFAYYFYVGRSDARRLTPKHVKMAHFDDGVATFNIEPPTTSVKSFAPLIKASFETVFGEQ